VSSTCAHENDPQLSRLTDAIEQLIGKQRYKVWFNPNSTKLDLRHDGLEIAVQNDFISDWIGSHYGQRIQEAAHSVLGCSLPVRYCVVPQLFEVNGGTTVEGAAAATTIASATNRKPDVNGKNGKNAGTNGNGKANGKIGAHAKTNGHTNGNGHVAAHKPANGEIAAAKAIMAKPSLASSNGESSLSVFASRPRLRHDLESFVQGPSNQLAYNAADYVSENPGAQYNPLFVHGNCGLGKTHLLQGLCKRFAEHHPTKRWMYLTGEEFTNEFLSALRTNKLDSFRRKVRDLDLLVIDDVHFLGGKRATQEEFLHTFNAIEAMGRQVVLASDEHPKMISEFGESLVNRFVSGMVVRIDPPNFATRCQILRAMGIRGKLNLTEPVIDWIARRVTQNVRELEGAITRITAHTTLTGRPCDVAMAQEALGDLDRQLVAPVKPENILASVCDYFGLEHKDLMSGRRQRTISLARSVAMFLVRKTAKLSFPEIGMRMGKRNHSTVISACRRIERAVEKNERLIWTSAVGDREEEATELVQRLEEHSRSLS
jgi:chromosomal replication initiator protein